jgi:hypothetical protein
MLKGIQIKDGMEHLITTLFADNTTIYMSKEDNFEDLKQILDQ